jgi:Protein of unknown function (DUF3574)
VLSRIVIQRSGLGILVGLIATLTACASAPTLGCKSEEQLAVHDSVPQGLTVSQASGEWRGADGALVHESSYLLHLVHDGDASSEKNVAELVSVYKERFQQEAVLRVKVRACVSF